MAVGAQLQEDIHESTRLHDVMGADLEHVSQRVIEVTELSYPVASSIIREIVLAGGKRLARSSSCWRDARMTITIASMSL